MRSLLIASLLVFVSCGKNNELKSSDSSTNAVNSIEMTRSFFTINHEEGKSNFRNKLLNSIVEETFPNDSKANVIRDYEELENFPVDAKDLSIYKSKEQTMAKVIVSLSTRIEIFFLPQGIPLQDLAAKMGIHADSDRTFKLLKNDFIKTSKGQTFYLVSVNHEDLIVNDQNFFQQVRFLNDNVATENIHLDGTKKFEFTVKYKYFTQQLLVQDFSKQVSGRFSRGCAEDGSCVTFCNYQMQVPSAEYTLIPNVALSELGFSVKINGKVFPIESLNPQKISEGTFKFSVVESEAAIGESGLQVVTSAIPTTLVATPGSNCAVNGTANIAHRTEFMVALNVWGRGEELRKIKL